EARREALETLAAQRAQGILSGLAEAGRLEYQAIEREHGLLDQDRPHFPARIAQHDSVADHETVVPQKLGALPGCQLDGQGGSACRPATARHKLPIGVVIRDGAESLLEETI